jgi:hypothetical protein
VTRYSPTRTKRQRKNAYQDCRYDRTSITQETMPDGTHSCFVRMSDDNAHVIAGNVDDVCKRLGVTVTAIGPLPPAKRTGKG